MDALVGISEMWAKRRAEEAATMCAKRRPTEDEIDRAMVIAKWFFGWTDETGPCPISITNGPWHKKLCALFEWIAVLEADNSNTEISGSAYHADRKDSQLRHAQIQRITDETRILR